MNRLILIGNGFDLAHGLKTSVKDFGIHYFTKVFDKLLSEGVYEDDLVLFKNIFPNRTLAKYQNMDFFELKNIIDSNSIISKAFKSPILEIMYNGFNNINWLNIEYQYFKSLIQNINPLEKNKILKTNKLFSKLKDEFIEYLSIENDKIGNNLFNNEIFESFTLPSNSSEFVLKINANSRIEKILFLNFNYTKTLDLYLQSVDEKFVPDLIHIHGKLDGKFGQPIFGYGDEFNKTYLTFEELNQNELYQHIKSFYYTLNTNYYNLTKYLDSGDFQIHVYGHSCGITDRTLLNQIFEHENCKSIKVFYYQKTDGTNDFIDKSYEISRHFKDKTLFRKKLVPFELSKPMPQILK